MPSVMCGLSSMATPSGIHYISQDSGRLWTGWNISLSMPAYASMSPTSLHIYSKTGSGSGADRQARGNRTLLSLCLSPPSGIRGGGGGTASLAKKKIPAMPVEKAGEKASAPEKGGQDPSRAAHAVLRAGGWRVGWLEECHLHLLLPYDVKSVARGFGREA